MDNQNLLHFDKNSTENNDNLWFSKWSIWFVSVNDLSDSLTLVM